MAKKKKWIAEAIKNPGSLKRELGVPENETIPKAELAEAAKEPGKIGRQARLAQTLSRLGKK